MTRKNITGLNKWSNCIHVNCLRNNLLISSSSVPSAWSKEHLIFLLLVIVVHHITIPHNHHIVHVWSSLKNTGFHAKLRADTIKCPHCDEIVFKLFNIRSFLCICSLITTSFKSKASENSSSETIAHVAATFKKD